LMYNFLSPSFPVSFALSSDFFALSPPSNSWRWLNQTLPCVAGFAKNKVLISFSFVPVGGRGLQYLMQVGVGLSWDCSRDNSEMNTMHWSSC
jgi:hypothetical protein